MIYFHSLPQAPADPIFGLNATCRKDPRSHKVNLGIGIYRPDDLQPTLMSVVQKAQERLVTFNFAKEYLAIDGDLTFVQETGKLLGLPLNVCGVQTVGGQGALCLIASLLARHKLIQTVFLPDPTWPNHAPTFTHMGLQVQSYPYYNKKSFTLDFEALCSFIEKQQAPSAILLHGCCHNPTGVDLTEVQWQELALLIAQKKILPIVDIAYQGLGKSLAEDAKGIQILAKSVKEIVVAYSYSKNMGLYGERVGALLAITEDEASLISQLKVLIRTFYSNPPTHGSAIARTILEDLNLTEQWYQELMQIRFRIQQMRGQLAHGLTSKFGSTWSEAVQGQLGLFALLPLSIDQINKLQETWAIYLPSNGRMNFAGLSLQNMEYVIEALLQI